MFCIFLYLIFDHPVDWQRFLKTYNLFWVAMLSKDF
jgi:hypothetical protein